MKNVTPTLIYARHSKEVVVGGGCSRRRMMINGRQRVVDVSEICNRCSFLRQWFNVAFQCHGGILELPIHPPTLTFNHHRPRDEE